jgi:hypothetical protein
LRTKYLLAGFRKAFQLGNLDKSSKLVEIHIPHSLEINIADSTLEND